MRCTNTSFPGDRLSRVERSQQIVDVVLHAANDFAKLGIEGAANLHQHTAFDGIVIGIDFEVAGDELVMAWQHPREIGIDLRHLVEENFPRSIDGMGEVDAGVGGDE